MVAGGGLSVSTTAKFCELPELAENVSTPVYVLAMMRNGTVGTPASACGPSRNTARRFPFHDLT